MGKQAAIWMPLVSTNSGAAVYGERLAKDLQQVGVRCELAYLPHRAEYLPWTVKKPQIPDWANIVFSNSWLHQRFVPKHLSLVSAVLHVNQNSDSAHSHLQKLYHQLWIYRCELANLKRAKKIICISKSTASSLRANFPKVAANKIQVIYNAVDSDLYLPSQRQISLQQEQKFHLLFIGNWSRRKGVDLLAPIMRQLGNNFHLTCISNAAADKLVDMPANISFKAKLTNELDIIKEYQHADALLFPSRLEGFGYVALEAQLCGVPVICSNNSSLPEIVVNNQTGILCETGNVAAFVQAVKYLANNFAIRQQMSKNAWQIARDKFSTATMVEQYIQAFEQVLS